MKSDIMTKDKDDKKLIDKEKIIAVLKTVEDPEIHIDVWTLGLIYDISVKDDIITIKMTFTSPMCPYGPYMMDEMKQKILKAAPGYKVGIELVFTPPWQPSEEVKEMLGLS
jgi:metal-sulfur cluster biosynthetic enzyme